MARTILYNHVFFLFLNSSKSQIFSSTRKMNSCSVSTQCTYWLKVAPFFSKQENKGPCFLDFSVPHAPTKRVSCFYCWAYMLQFFFITIKNFITIMKTHVRWSSSERLSFTIFLLIFTKFTEGENTKLYLRNILAWVNKLIN